MESKVIASFKEWYGTHSEGVTIGEISNGYAHVNFNGGYNNFWCKINTRGVVKNSWRRNAS